jgi:hypothetical protein
MPRSRQARPTAFGLAGRQRIPDGEVFLMYWQSAESLDRRYLGLLSVTTIVGRADSRLDARGGLIVLIRRRKTARIVCVLTAPGPQPRDLSPGPPIGPRPRPGGSEAIVADSSMPLRRSTRVKRARGRLWLLSGASHMLGYKTTKSEPPWGRWLIAGAGVSQ